MSVGRADQLTVSASSAAVLAVLTDAPRLAEWNPAFSEVIAGGPATVGEPVRIRVQGLLGGHLTYDHIAPDRIDMTIRIPGLTEVGTWRLAPVPGATLVSHSFTQAGPLAMALRNATRDVATLRLHRLRDRVGGRP